MPLAPWAGAGVSPFLGKRRRQGPVSQLLTAKTALQGTAGPRAVAATWSMKLRRGDLTSAQVRWALWSGGVWERTHGIPFEKLAESAWGGHHTWTNADTAFPGGWNNLGWVCPTSPHAIPVWKLLDKNISSSPSGKG